MIKATYNEVLNAKTALTRLDSFFGIQREGAIEKPVERPAEYKSGVVLKMAILHNRLDCVVKDYAKARERIRAQIAGEDHVIPEKDVVRNTRFSGEVNDLLQQNVEIDAAPLTLEDLDLERNRHAPSAIGALGPFLSNMAPTSTRS